MNKLSLERDGPLSPGASKTASTVLYVCTYVLTEYIEYITYSIHKAHCVVMLHTYPSAKNQEVISESGTGDDLCRTCLWEQFTLLSAILLHL